MQTRRPDCQLLTSYRSVRDIFGKVFGKPVYRLWAKKCSGRGKCLWKTSGRTVDRLSKTVYQLWQTVYQLSKAVYRLFQSRLSSTFFGANMLITNSNFWQRSRVGSPKTYKTMKTRLNAFACGKLLCCSDSRNTATKRESVQLDTLLLSGTAKTLRLKQHMKCWMVPSGKPTACRRKPTRRHFSLR